MGKKLRVFKVLSERDCLTDDSRLEHKANRLWIPEDSSFNLNKVNITSNNYRASRTLVDDVKSRVPTFIFLYFTGVAGPAFSN